MRRCRIQLSIVRGDTSYRSAMPALFVKAAPIRSAIPGRLEEFFLSSALAIDTKDLRLCPSAFHGCGRMDYQPADYARLPGIQPGYLLLTWQEWAAPLAKT